MFRLDGPPPPAYILADRVIRDQERLIEAQEQTLARMRHDRRILLATLAVQRGIIASQRKRLRLQALLRRLKR